MTVLNEHESEGQGSNKSPQAFVWDVFIINSDAFKVRYTFFLNLETYSNIEFTVRYYDTVCLNFERVCISGMKWACGGLKWVLMLLAELKLNARGKLSLIILNKIYALDIRIPDICLCKAWALYRYIVISLWDTFTYFKINNLHLNL